MGRNFLQPPKETDNGVEGEVIGCDRPVHTDRGGLKDTVVITEAVQCLKVVS